MSIVNKRIVGHSGIYLLGSLLARAVSFIMLPIYTRSLTPADYGVIELLSMIIDLVGLLLSLRIGQSVYRHYFKYERREDQNQVLFSAYVMTMASSVIGTVCLLLLSKKFAIFVFGNIEMSKMIGLFSLSILFQGLVETPMVMLRAQQKPWMFLAASITKLIMQLGLNVYFVVFKHMHVEGVIYSTLVSGCAMSLILGTYLVRTTGFSFSIPKAREMMHFSLPYVAVGALSFYINFGDRYFLKFFGNGLDAIGVYSLGYKFGFLLIFIVGDPFFNVWDSEKFRIYRENANPSVVFRRVFLAYSAVLALAVLGLSLFGRNVIMVMANKEFWKAAELIPFVSMAYAFNCMEGFVNLGFLVKDRTIELTYGTILAGVVVSASYFFLIPRFGGMGAAWATLLAFGARLIWNVICSKKHFDMNLDWSRVIGLWVVAGVIWKAADLLGSGSVAVSLLVNTVSVVICIGALLYLPILPEDLRKEARTWLLNPRSSLRSFKVAFNTK